MSYVGLLDKLQNKEESIGLCKNSYNIDLVLQFYKKDDVEELPVSDKGFDYTIFTLSSMESQNKNNQLLKSTSVDNIQKPGFVSKMAHSNWLKFMVPFSKYVLPKEQYDEVSINLFEDLDNEQYQSQRLKIEVIELQNLQIKEAKIRVER